MSGIEALGVVASATQLVAYSIKIVIHLRFVIITERPRLLVGVRRSDTLVIKISSRGEALACLVEMRLRMGRRALNRKPP